MTTLDTISHGIKGTLESLSDGWQHLWQKARDAVTHFKPDSEATVPEEKKKQAALLDHAQWGVLSADVKETNDAIEVQLEAPGMEGDDFNIYLDGERLIVSGRKSHQSESDEGRFHITQRAYGLFERIIPLPCAVVEPKTKAQYRNGVLTINLPKQGVSTSKKIPVG